MLLSQITPGLSTPVASAVNRLLKLDQLDSLYQRARSGKPLAGELLRELDITVQIADADLTRVPKAGPVIAVSNHPFGLLDGVVLTDMLTRLRSDVRILTNGMLGTVPELAEICIFVDPFDRRENRAANARSLREAITHVKSGGLLLIFPAGEVSHFDPKGAAVRDPAWRETAARLVRVTRARVIPIYVQGSNSLSFQMLGLIHARLRTAAIPGEFLNKRGHAVEVRIGSPIEASRISAFDTDAQAIAYLRRRSEWMAGRGAVAGHEIDESVPVETGVASSLFADEIARLPELCLLARAGELEVYVAEAPRIPCVLREIGRLRELTFRAVREGTGRALDLDRFDEYYLHLFAWNRERREVVGAYRMGIIPHILLRFGTAGLYTNTQFRFDERFFKQLGPAIELGRSFVRVEYQRQFMPLALLWRGVCAWIARRPEYATLIGAVSVSRQYSKCSRELIAAYFGMPDGTASRVRARKPLRAKPMKGTLPLGVEDLSEWISDVEADRKGLPVLVRQYVKLGGRILAFSVDPAFGDTLDGLVRMDLRLARRESLERYMGRAEAAGFLAWHGTAGHVAA